MHRVLYFILLICLHEVSTSKKKGIAVGPGLYKCNDTWAFTDISWWYDWHANLYTHSRHGCLNRPNGEYVPMLWGEARMHNATVYSISEHVLGFNEPNIKNQANMTPERAAALWPEVETKASGRTLISPAIAGCDNAQHCINWFTKFFAACRKCRVDALAVHAYNCDAKHLATSLETIAKHFNKKIWLTEFACHSAKTQEQQLHYMKQILPLLESSPFVVRYAWYETRTYKNTTFITSTTDLLDRNASTLNKLGQFYDSYKHSGIVG